MEVEVTDRYDGDAPSQVTACDECEGTGFDPGQPVCAACGGTGRRVPLRRARMLEFIDSFVAPAHFALFWWGEHGFMPEGASASRGSAVSAFRMVWRDRAHARSVRKLLRGLVFGE